ncbi:MAG: Crp/Fnr family transcriptional regulator [Bacteroidales bacterium]|nr:Crp/Fnr family transcriptional regulator [Bacteroidales bacterium]
MFSETLSIPTSCCDCRDKSCAAAVLSMAEINLVNENHREAEFKKGNILTHEGSMTSHIIYLKSGLVKEYVKSNNEKEHILQIIKKFSYLGLPSLFGDRINHYSYAALEDIKVCYIDAGIFNQLVKQNGNFAYEILVSISRESLNNFHRFMRQSQKKTYGRMADAILYFSTIIFEQNTFDIPFSRQELADLIGISRESATRVLIKFRDDGILSLEGRAICINNLELLRQISKNG